MLPYLTLFGKSIPTYGLMAALGIAAALAYITLTNRGGQAGHIPAVDVLHLLALAVPGAIVGAKLLYLIVELPAIVQNWSYLWQNPNSLWTFLKQGLVFYGGLAGGLGAVYAYCRRYRLPYGAVLNICTPAIPLFHIFGRIGCFFAGCCWGIPAVYGISFHQAPFAPNGIPLLPVQLIEAACNLLLFVFLAAFSRRARAKALTFPLYLLGYGLLRFVLEFFRGDALRGIFVLSTSQWLSLVAIALGLILLRKFYHAKSTVF